jgi:phospholipid/cholesterol/gamma-HCH transport system ATP-binding protein
MLYPHARMSPGDPQVIYDGPPDGLATSPDDRVRHFVEGNAADRLQEMAIE